MYYTFLRTNLKYGFRSVVVITSASHAEGPRFEPGREQPFVEIFEKLIFLGSSSMYFGHYFSRLAHPHTERNYAAHNQ